MSLDLVALGKLAEEQSGKASDLHGPNHWKRVAWVGLELLDIVPQADRELVMIFACLHDCQRENEDKDPEHGLRAAHLAKSINESILHLEKLALEKLAYILEYHDKGLVSTDPTVGVCWDSDRLNLWRVGKIPDPGLLSTEQGKSKIQWSRQAERLDIAWQNIQDRFEGKAVSIQPPELTSKPDLSESIISLLQRQEELDDELKPYIENFMAGMESLRHPLVFSVPYFPQENARLNVALKQKRLMLQKAIEGQDWDSCIFLHERPYRLHAFTRFATKMSDQEYWKNLSQVYIDSENLFQAGARTVGLLLRSGRPGRSEFMSSEEITELANHSDPITIYRGQQKGRKISWSWSLSETKAKWFALRFARPGNRSPELVKATCAKKDVLGLLLRRGEQEIVVDPRLVVVLERLSLEGEGLAL